LKIRQPNSIHSCATNFKEESSMSSIKKYFVALSVVTALIGSGTAAADVKVGFLAGFTGPLKSLAPGMYKSAKLAAKHVNDQGGILDGQQMIMPSGDSTCSDVTAAVDAATHLVEDENVLAIVGPLCSGAAIAIYKNVTIPAGITVVSPSATSPEITSLNDGDLVFRTSPSDVYQGSIMARLLLSKGIKHIGITYVDNDWGKGISAELSSAFETAGGKVAGNLAHEEGKTDYSDVIRSLSATGVDTLVVLAYANGSGQTILRQAVESGAFDQFVGGDGMASNTLIAAIGSDKLRGMIVTKPGAPDSTGARVFNKYAWGGNLNPAGAFVGQSYDAAFLLALAIEKNGSADRAGIARTLRAIAAPPGEVILPGEWAKAKALIKSGKPINYEGATGSLDFDKAGDVSGVIIEMGVNVREGSLIEFGQIR
jgi:branched-chain amino acid transport system substrate-binding protein